MKKIISIICILSFFPSVVFAVPSVADVSGNIVDGEQISIFGIGFGETGPNIILFDDFSRGTEGGLLTSSANIGVWDKIRSTGFADSLLSNDKGARCFGPPTDTTPAGGWYNNNTVLLGGVQSEVFISSRAYVPDGYYFPASIAEETYPDISALKFFWLYYTATGYATDNDPDLVATCFNSPTSTYNLFANDYARATLDRDMDWRWEWDKPVRYAFWIKGNGTSVAGSDGLYQSVSSTGQSLVSYHETFAWFAESDNVFGFDRLTVPGFLTGASNTQSAFVIDDVYVAVGPNAAARVEIGNNINYSSCTKLAIITPSAWSDGEITATVREGTFNDDEQAYLYVVDENGEVNANGYPITNYI